MGDYREYPRKWIKMGAMRHGKMMRVGGEGRKVWK